MLLKIIALFLFLGSGQARAQEFCYGELRPDPAKFLDLPAGFSYQTLMQSGQMMTDGKPFPYRPDLTVYMPLGKERALLVVSHELAADRHPPEWGTGALTQLYLVRSQIEKSKILTDGMRLNCSGSLTPWGTILTNEEFPREYEKFPDEGYVWEVDPITGKRWRRDAMGRFSHESSVVAKDGSVYLTEDYEDGLLYRFIPNETGDLSQGKLYAYNRAKRYWIVLDKLHEPRHSGILRDATPFNRLEGLALSNDGFLYISETGSSAKNDPHGRILKMDLANWRMEVFYEGSGPTISGPDNIAFDMKGNLWVLEDQGHDQLSRFGPNEIWMISKRGRACLFARLAHGDCEATGPAFSNDGAALFMNFHCGKGPDRMIRLDGPLPH